MRFDGALGDEEFSSDFGIGTALCDLLEDFHLTCGQVGSRLAALCGRPDFGHQPPGDARMEDGLATAGCVDRVQDRFRVGIFEQLGESAGFDGGEEQLISRVAREHDNLSAWAALADLACGLYAPLIGRLCAGLQG